MIATFRSFWTQFKALPWERQTLLTAGALALIPILATLLTSRGSTASEGVTSTAPTEFDTIIPKGFVLVPIEVQNFESLDSILGRFALVDLFRSSGIENSAQRLVAKNVRLLRAPHNPSHFAVLVKEDDVDRILEFGGAFVVVIKRRAEYGTEFVKERSKRRIIYD